jgi:hypothetical protein
MMTGVSNMISAGFDLQKEPFLRGVLSTIRVHLLQDLKNKTRIFVPEAALLIGNPLPPPNPYNIPPTRKPCL